VVQTKTLDRIMRREYKGWVENMPASFSEGLFRDNQPITISYQYGQNSPLQMLSPPEEAAVFQQAHDLKYVRTMSFAIAVHMR